MNPPDCYFVYIILLISNKVNRDGRKKGAMREKNGNEQVGGLGGGEREPLVVCLKFPRYNSGRNIRYQYIISI